MKNRLLLVLLTYVVPIIAMAQTTLIKEVNVVDVETGKIIVGQNILIQNSKIHKISNKPLSSVHMDTVVNGKDKYLIPGLIDSHIHFFQSGSIYTRPDAIDLTKKLSYESEMAFAKKLVPDSFKRYLRLGITTIADVGGPFYNFEIRDSLAKSSISPNVLVTGPLFSPYQPAAFAEVEDVPIAKISSIQQADSLFDKMIEYKPNFIKIWYIVDDKNPAEKTYPIVEHIAERTHENHLKLAVHATDYNTARLAVKAGADILVHSVRDTVLSSEFLELLKKKKVSYNPTLIVSNNYLKAFLCQLDLHPQDLQYANSKAYGTLFDLKSEDFPRPERLENIVNRANDIKARIKSRDSIISINLLNASKKGVNIITGTDAGNIGTMHASSYIQELEAMSDVGLPNKDILKASTLNAAKAFGLENRLGKIEEGKAADLVLLNGNPIEDLKELMNISAVFKDGKTLDLNELAKESPELIVQRQVNAYNARNIDAFMDTYSENIKIFNFPEELRMEGKSTMRDRFKELFDKFPNLYCEIKNRIVLGNKVIDRERVRFGDKYSDVIAIYEVIDGKISKVTFVR